MPSGMVRLTTGEERCLVHSSTALSQGSHPPLFHFTEDRPGAAVLALAEQTLIIGEYGRKSSCHGAVIVGESMRRAGDGIRNLPSGTAVYLIGMSSLCLRRSRAILSPNAKQGTSSLKIYPHRCISNYGNPHTRIQM